MAIWVFSDEIDGGPAPSALELLTKARSWGGEVGVVYVGSGGDAAWSALGAHGAGSVLHIDPGDVLPAAGVTAALAELVASHQPQMVLFGMGPNDRDVAGRLSARLGVSVLANAVDVAVDGATITVTNEILGGTTRVASAFTGAGPALVVVRPKAFPAEPADSPASPQVTAVAMPEAGAATIVARHVETSEGPDLEAAAVVVSGGRGLGDAAKFSMLDDLAGLLGGAVGATRAVVDAGWVPYSYQVGQTGKTVKPSVYLACGISGAMQHVVGMKDSGTIIAINKDSEAPIFGLSDLGIVGDVHQVVPKLIEALQARG